MSLACYIHPSSSAQDRCAACRRTICPSCVVADRAAILCRSCAERIARDKRGQRVRLVLIASIIAVAALWLIASIAGGGCAAAAGPLPALL
jgi:hypothetical protein